MHRNYWSMHRNYWSIYRNYWPMHRNYWPREPFEDLAAALVSTQGWQLPSVQPGAHAALPLLEAFEKVVLRELTTLLQAS